MLYKFKDYEVTSIPARIVVSSGSSGACKVIPLRGLAGTQSRLDRAKKHFAKRIDALIGPQLHKLGPSDSDKKKR